MFYPKTRTQLGKMRLGNWDPYASSEDDNRKGGLSKVLPHPSSSSLQRRLNVVRNDRDNFRAMWRCRKDSRYRNRLELLWPVSSMRIG